MEVVVDVRSQGVGIFGTRSRSRDAAQSDATLLDRVAAGDRPAFEEIYRRYARAVLALAMRRLRDRGRAEDATQDTFSAIWRAAARFDRSRSSGAAWIFTIARNAVVDEGRRRRDTTVGELPEIAADTPEPDAETERAWTAWRLHRALADLPAQERTLLELAYYSGLSQQEVAVRVGIPLGTVKTRTRSGLARLADLLEGELG
jgi:RNA polymerase sigma-70 factor (ECF subfamily)